MTAGLTENGEMDMINVFKGNNRTKKMTAMGVLFAVIFAVFTIGCIVSKSQECAASTKPENKYFTNIIIDKGDTLWDVASEYMDDEHYDSIYDYMNELRSMNNLKSDTLYEGQNFIVTYYAVSANQ